MKQTILNGFILLGCAAAVGINVKNAIASKELAATMSAEEIMHRVDSRDDGSSFFARRTMILIDKRGRRRTRTFDVYSKDYGEDSKNILFFTAPADLRGTSYLSFNWDDESVDDDSWLYLTSLQQVKRLASSDKSNSFLGSDFTYADTEGLNINWYDYQFISQSELVDGYDCWVIEVKPKSEYKEKAEKYTGDLKSHVWIRKDNFVQVRGKIWVKKGKKVKFYSATDLAEIDGIWTTRKVQMVTTKNGKTQHASVVQTDEIEYNLEIEDAFFTTKKMQRGVAR